MTNNKRRIFVLSGPSGCGKNTVYDELKKINPDIAQTVSATTRAKRSGETDGVDYYFIPREKFQEMVKNGEFVEYVRYGDNFYGTLKREIERLTEQNRIVILIIEVNGAANIKKLFPDATSIFILPPSFDELKKRIIGRGTEQDDDIKKRIELAKEELTYQNAYDYRVVNDNLADCVNEVCDIIKGVK